MGLDMYAYTRNSSGKGMGSELKYWRKNNALHNWMYQLWCKKAISKKQGGVCDLDEFNCTAMELTKEDILQLRSDIRENKLEPTAGFFWGILDYPDWQKEDDIEFCFRALDEIQDGCTVTYCADW